MSTLSLQFISNGIEQSVPAQPSMQTQRYSPSSSVHWPCREHPFSHPAIQKHWIKKNREFYFKKIKQEQHIFLLMKSKVKQWIKYKN